MSIVLGLLVVSGGVVLGRALAQRLRERRSTEGEQVGEAKTSSADPLAAFPCHLGDVVVRTAERDEVWLAGALIFEEERPVAALFVAPEAGGDRALLAREGADELVWLSPMPVGELALTADPPHTVDHRGVRFARVRRLPVRVTRKGTGAPGVGDHAVLAEYEGQGSERIVVVAGSEQKLAWIGSILARKDYDVLPGS